MQFNWLTNAMRIGCNMYNSSAGSSLVCYDHNATMQCYQNCAYFLKMMDYKPVEYLYYPFDMQEEVEQSNNNDVMAYERHGEFEESLRYSAYAPSLKLTSCKKVEINRYFSFYIHEEVGQFDFIVCFAIMECERYDENRCTKLIRHMAMKNPILFFSFHREVGKFGETDLGKMYAEIVESYKRRELNSKKIADYIEKMKIIDGSDTLVKELEKLLEQSKIDEEKSESFWPKFLQPSTSGTAHAIKPFIYAFMYAFRVLSENHAVRRITRDLVEHLGEEAFRVGGEMAQSSQSSALTPDQNAEMLRRMQDWYSQWLGLCKDE